MKTEADLLKTQYFSNLFKPCSKITAKDVSYSVNLTNQNTGVSWSVLKDAHSNSYNYIVFEK